MASTTLNTFFLPAPEFHVRSVEMKGSWDIFEKSYQLKKDSQTGNWRCCHAFENIVCDGVTLETSTSRDGGLKMGGTYWYYYILHTIDGDLETFSEREPRTRSCPLLPGQTMNVLEVPMQSSLVHGRNVSSTSIDSLVFTLDPKDKYLPPGVRRAATTSAIKQRKSRMSVVPKIVHRADSTPLQSESPPKTSSSGRMGQSTLKRQRSLMSVYQRMRQIRSAGSNTKSSLAWPRKIFSRAGQQTKAEEADDIPEVPKLPSHISSPPPLPKDVEMDLPIQLPPTAHQMCTTPQAEAEAVEESVIVPWPHESTPIGDYLPAFPRPPDFGRDDKCNSVNDSCEPPAQLHYHASLESLDTDTYFAEFSAVVGGDLSSNSQEHAAPLLPPSRHADEEAFAKGSDDESPGVTGQQESEDRFHATTYLYPESSRFSYPPSESLSPGMISNTTHSGPMSPLHLSQPETPTMSDFEDDYDHELLQLHRCSESSAPLTVEDSGLEGQALPPPSRAPPPPPRSKASSTTPQSAFSGFQGYSLPQDDYKSVLTIKKLPSTSFKISDTMPPLPQRGDKQDLVHSWNDGSEQILDDLGYLGELII